MSAWIFARRNCIQIECITAEKQYSKTQVLMQTINQVDRKFIAPVADCSLQR
jgi:hypothetical protein